jgi:hypothetical protein
MATMLKQPLGRTYQSDNIIPTARVDIMGGGQVTIDGDYAYIGYMYGPDGTSILDISDPRNPRTPTSSSIRTRSAWSATSWSPTWSSARGAA